MILRLVLTSLASLLISTPALAGAPLSLRADISDADGVVTLGDIFDGAGPAAQTPVAARTASSVMLSAASVQAAARRAGLVWPNAEGLRQIFVSGPVTNGAVTARANVDVLTWTRNLAAGEIVQPEDLIWGKAALTPSDAPGDADAVVGLSARRALRAGAAVAARDVAAPQVIKANEMITLSFEDGGVSLALQAKALAGGAAGETISVQNISSKKVIPALIVGPGQALVGPAADRMKLNRNPRLALR